MTPDPIPHQLAHIEPKSAASERQSSAWDIRNAPKNYIWLVIYQIGSAIFSFGAVWLITRKLGSEGYGGIVAIVAASQVAQVFVSWSRMAVVRFGVEEFVETEKIARVFWTRLIILVVNLALVLVFANVWFPPLAEWLKISPGRFWLVIIHFVATVFWMHIQMSLLGAKMPRVQGFLKMTERLLIVGAILTMIAAGWMEFVGIVVSYVATSAAMAFVGVFHLRRYIFAPFAVDRPFIKKVFAYSVPLVPFSFVGYFSGSYVDAVFVSKFLSISVLGIYSVATQINGIALQLPTLANVLLLPLFVTLQSESENQRSFNYFRNVLPTLTLLWGFACAALALVGYFAIPLIFGSEFQTASAALVILLSGSAIALPAMLGYFPYSHALSATYITMFGAILAAIANIAGNFVLIPRFGLVGCAYATAIGYFVNVLTTALLLRLKAGLPISWNFMALVPATVSGSSLILTGNAWVSLALFAILASFLAIVKRESIGRGISFVRTMLRGNNETAAI